MADLTAVDLYTYIKLFFNGKCRLIYTMQPWTRHGICLAKLPEVTFSAGTVLDLAGNDLGALDTSASWLLGDFFRKNTWHQQIWRNQPTK